MTTDNKQQEDVCGCGKPVRYLTNNGPACNKYARCAKREERKQELYYCQDTRNVVGNCILWWARQGGYTCHLKDAEVFTAEKIKSGFSDHFRFWPKESIDKCATLQVDHQLLRDVKSRAQGQ